MRHQKEEEYRKLQRRWPLQLACGEVVTNWKFGNSCRDQGLDLAKISMVLKIGGSGMVPFFRKSFSGLGPKFVKFDPIFTLMFWFGNHMPCPCAPCVNLIPCNTISVYPIHHQNFGWNDHICQQSCCCVHACWWSHWTFHYFLIRMSTISVKEFLEWSTSSQIQVRSKYTRFHTWPHSPDALKRRFQILGLNKAASKITKLIVSGFQYNGPLVRPNLPAATLKLVADWIIWWRNYVKSANSIPLIADTPKQQQWSKLDDRKFERLLLNGRHSRILFCLTRQRRPLPIPGSTVYYTHPRRNAIPVSNDEFDQFMPESEFTIFIWFVWNVRIFKRDDVCSEPWP